jgi:hypothetical protein
MRATTLLVLVAGCGSGAVLIDDEGFEPAVVLDPSGTPGPDGTVPTDPSGGTPTEPEGPAPDYSRPGPYPVESEGGRFAASCSMAYTTFLPVGREPTTLVVLSHGFLRAKEQMAGTAEHLASWGLAVATPDLCHLDLLDVDYEQNAHDLADLGAELGHGAPVVQAGHSAGGLSSFLAAGIDPLCVGHVGLDLADFDGLGALAAPALPVPAWALLAEPEFCNNGGDAAGVYAAAPDARGVRVDGADHCDFESPTDWTCEVACADGAGDDEVVADAIVGLVTAAALALSGDDPRGAQYWTPGEDAHDGLVTAGVITDL